VTSEYPSAADVSSKSILAVGNDDDKFTTNTIV
jgi:hypothetical protein